jgi:ribosome modulation factor
MNNYHIAGDPHRYPNLFDRWNRAHRGAYKKGVAAYHAGDHLIHGCPYKDKRKESGRLSWSRSFICAWEDGWRDARSQAADLIQHNKQL